MAYFAASCDPVEKNKRFAESLKLDYPILSDPDGKTARRYGVYLGERGFSSRTTIFIDADGKISYIDRKINVGAHGTDMARRLKQLGVARVKAADR